MDIVISPSTVMFANLIGPVLVGVLLWVGAFMIAYHAIIGLSGEMVLADFDPCEGEMSEEEFLESFGFRFDEVLADFGDEDLSRWEPPCMGAVALQDYVLANENTGWDCFFDMAA